MTRERIIQTAANLASDRSLDGVTIGVLADELGMSKSGVVGHFGTKEALQLATLDFATDRFRELVWEPVKDQAPGLPRLLAICDSWIAYAENSGFDGGCCVVQISYEFDSRTGAVHDKVAAAVRRWRRVLVADIEAAVVAGDLASDVNAAQLAFGLESIASGMAPSRMLQGDADTRDWARQAMRTILGLHPQTPTPI